MYARETSVAFGTASKRFNIITSRSWNFNTKEHIVWIEASTFAVHHNFGYSLFRTGRYQTRHCVILLVEL